MLIKRICLIAIAAVAIAAVVIKTGMEREALSGVEGELVSEEGLALNGGNLELGCGVWLDRCVFL